MNDFYTTIALILISSFLISLGIATFIAAKHASEKKYLCKQCKKIFSPRMKDAIGAAYSFGHTSVLVRCPHCRNKERLFPIYESKGDKQA